MITVTPTYPGFYIEEDAFRSISVSHEATAGPVFIGVFRGLDGMALSSGHVFPYWLNQELWSEEHGLTGGIQKSIVNHCAG